MESVMKRLIILCFALFVVQTAFAEAPVPSEYARAINQIDKEIATLNAKRDDLTFRIETRRLAIEDYDAARETLGKINRELGNKSSLCQSSIKSGMLLDYEWLCDRNLSKNPLVLKSSGIALKRYSDLVLYVQRTRDTVADLKRSQPALEKELDGVVGRIGILEADRQQLLGGINANRYVQAITGRWYLDWNTSVITVTYDTRTKDFVGVITENDFAFFNQGDVLFHARFDKEENGRPIFIGVMFGRTPDGKREDEIITLVVNGDKIDYQRSSGDQFILYRRPPF